MDIKAECKTNYSKQKTPTSTTPPVASAPPPSGASQTNVDKAVVDKEKEGDMMTKLKENKILVLGLIILIIAAMFLMGGDDNDDDRGSRRGSPPSFQINLFDIKYRIKVYRP